MRPRYYFVWRIDDKHPFRAYSERAYFLPVPDDPNYRYHGNNFESAREMAKNLNADERLKKQKKPEMNQEMLDLK